MLRRKCTRAHLGPVQTDVRERCIHSASHCAPSPHHIAPYHIAQTITPHHATSHHSSDHVGPLTHAYASVQEAYAHTHLLHTGTRTHAYMHTYTMRQPGGAHTKQLLRVHTTLRTQGAHAATRTHTYTYTCTHTHTSTCPRTPSHTHTNEPHATHVKSTPALWAISF